MSKDNIELKDVIHLYLGCEVVHSHLGKLSLIGVTEGIPWLKSNEMPLFRANPDQIKLILRPLSDIKQLEHTDSSLAYTNGLNNCADDVSDWVKDWNCESERVKYLLSRHFDLFGLIENNLAIDKNAKQ